MIKVFYRKEVFWKFTLTRRLDIITLQFNLMYQSTEPLHRVTIIHTHTEIIFLLSTRSILTCFHTLLSSWHLPKVTWISLMIETVSCFFLLLFFDVYCLKHSKHTTTHTGWWKTMRNTSIWIQVSLTNMTKYYKPWTHIPSRPVLLISVRKAFTYFDESHRHGGSGIM